MTVTCVRVGCSKPLPDVAVANEDAWCSRKCCELDNGVSMAADLTGGIPSRSTSSVGRSHYGFGGPRVPVTLLEREAAARSLEAFARVARESRRTA